MAIVEDFCYGAGQRIQRAYGHLAVIPEIRSVWLEAQNSLAVIEMVHFISSVGH